MSNNTVYNLFSERKYDEILKTNSKFFESPDSDKALSEDSILIYFISLVKSGYYLKAIEIITDYLTKIIALDKKIETELLFLVTESYFSCNNYTEGKKYLEKLKIILSNQEILSTTIYNSCIYALFESTFSRLPIEFIKVDESISKLIEKIDEGNQEQIADCLLQRGFFYRINQKYDKMFEDFEECKIIYSYLGNKYGLAKTYFQIGYSYIVLDKLNKAQLNFEKSCELFKELGNMNFYAYSLTYLGHVYTKKGDLQTAENLLLQSLNYPRLFENDYFKIFTKEKMADNYSIRGELGKALDYYLEVERYFAKNNLKMLGGILNKIGTIKSTQGNFENSLMYHREALEIFTSIRDVLGIPWTNIYLGESLFQMGDFDSALAFWLKSFNQFQDLENEHGLGFSCVNIGKVYLVLNDDKSLQYYQKAVNIFEKIENLEGTIESYIGYGILLEEHGNLSESEKYLNKARAIIRDPQQKNSAIGEKIYKYSLISLENSLGRGDSFINLILTYFNQNQDTRRNKQRKVFLNAVLINKVNRLRDKIKALELFESITKGEIIDYYTTLLSYLYILETIIFELKIFNNVEILTDANEILEDITKLTSANSFSSWAVRTLALKAQIALIEFKYDDAKNLLNDAITIASSKNMKRLVFQLSNQYDEMVSQIVKLNDLKTSKEATHSLADVLEITDFSIFDPNRDKFKFEIPDEEPTYLSLIDTSGMTLYSFNFNFNSTEDFDQLMSGFLIAINSVISRLFSSSGFIERIKHKEYTITLFSLIDPVYICYAYKGLSYHAQTKIEQLKKELIEHPFLKSLLEASNKKRTLNLSEQSEVENLVHKIFNSYAFNK